jgi:hypothetical protein
MAERLDIEAKGTVKRYQDLPEIGRLVSWCTNRRSGFQPRIEPRKRSFKGGEIMRCNRCGAMMIYEEIYGNCEHCFGGRCIVCGEIIDQVILENRLKCLSEMRRT